MGWREPDEAAPARRMSTGALVALNLAAAVVIAGLTALGVWQVQRRAWKLDLIERVEARVGAAPVPIPVPGEPVTAQADEYRHVTISGHWLPDRTTLVQAVTVLGGGFWVIDPLSADTGQTVLVNRGFVPADRRDPSARTPATGTATVTGLMRMSEPGGGFLRTNDPASGRWYSRDVEAIARAENLGQVAPYFIDADAASGSAGAERSLPVGGLTVVAFTNNHLVYAITWFALAAMTAGAIAFVDLGAARARRAAIPKREARPS